MQIVEATERDAAKILEYIKTLAAEEAFPYPVTVSLKDLRENLFKSSEAVSAVLFKSEDKVFGFAVYYLTFATTTGKKGIHLDDFYIEPEYRSLGYGRQFMSYLSEMATQKGFARFEWACVKSNLKARQFYRDLGASELDELCFYRINVPCRD